MKKLVSILLFLSVCVSVTLSSTNTAKASIASEAEEYEIGEQISGTVPWYSSEKGADYYKFTINESSHVSFWVNCEYNNRKTQVFNQEEPCVIYTIYNSDGKAIVNNNNFKFKNNPLTGYTIGEYSKNLSSGTYYLEVKSQFEEYNYSFKFDSERIIKLEKGKIQSVQGNRKMIKVICKNAPDALGYKIQYSMDYLFKKDVKSMEITNTSVKIKKLQSKKYYYVRICPFAAYEDGEKVYGSYSKIKKVMVK